MMRRKSSLPVPVAFTEALARAVAARKEAQRTEGLLRLQVAQYLQAGFSMTKDQQRIWAESNGLVREVKMPEPQEDHHE